MIYFKKFIYLLFSVRIQKIQYGIVLIFENVAKNAEGDYKCIAEDDIIQEISFTLNVEGTI